ncbi:hypothetical protein C1I98_18580 [Spongiactinospora gelatinilytica]|uniref:HTH rpiR-type domain-containing protein n=1 Tax=Spongiactinospora gelatinilytica TaxID=2666298 RepID=A0A2W2G503_9ACTN|nr:MurR/RpiR family transcriptional regulator [Spongiactinospora gelatinilytica]PZG43281.1 hypothetical protein C1I98_18580 [Spongiactinospora gelatinilytica]
MSKGELVPGGAAARIRALLPSLVPSERRVADVCLKRPAAVIEWSVAEPAAAAGTSTATVVRACKTLGFEGFQHLRLMLARDTAQLGAPSEPPEDAPAGIVSAVFKAAAGSLGPALETLEESELDRAVEVVADARRLLLVGAGGSDPPVQDAALRFVCAGRPAEAPIDAITQTLTARLLSPADACVVVSHRASTSSRWPPPRRPRRPGPRWWR